MAERTKTLDIIRVTSNRIRYLVNLITAQIQQEQQCSNTNADSQHHTRADLLKTQSHVLQQTAKELEITVQAIIMASQETIGQSRELRTQSQRIQANGADAIPTTEQARESS